MSLTVNYDGVENPIPTKLQQIPALLWVFKEKVLIWLFPLNQSS